MGPHGTPLRAAAVIAERARDANAAAADSAARGRTAGGHPSADRLLMRRDGPRGGRAIRWSVSAVSNFSNCLRSMDVRAVIA